jgi:murein DD-endopeptidase MepM/ murein hydrolase activator NlpD
VIDKRFVIGTRARYAGLVAAVALCGVAAQAMAATSGGVGTGGSGGTATTTDGAFPVRGHHTYGDGIGAGRDHQGQDIMAKCGKPVVAALPGRIKIVDYHPAAGNYVVIDSGGKMPDTAYMHLAHRASVRKRELVQPGDQLGVVGDTGNASACHLHFEMWSAPGYYSGGSVIDPLPYLKRWDKAS